MGIINLFLGAKGVNVAIPDTMALFPPGWKVGTTTIPVTVSGRLNPRLVAIIPHLDIVDARGTEFVWVNDATDNSQFARIKASWDTPVDIIAGILSSVTSKTVTKEDVLKLAQSSPQALEKLKEAGKVFKAHLTRLFDPVSLSRSPEYEETSARFKAQLRVLINDQQAKIREAKIATRRVNQLLGERDEALAKLDSRYEPKRATAAQALAQFGISLEEDQSTFADDGAVTGIDLEDLNF
nr:MAG: hypothetical protein [Penicillium miczynskii RNA virus 1]